MSFKITWKTHLICCLISLIITIGSYPVVDLIIGDCFSQTVILYPTQNYALNFIILVVFLMVPITIIHEAIHGAVHKFYGGKVKFGFKGIYAYTQEVSGLPIDINKFGIVLLAPLSLISVLSFLLPLWLGGLVYLLNLLGSSGDIYMAFKMFSYPKGVKIVDKSYGFDTVESP